MKEITRQYGAAVIAAVTAVLIILLIMQLPAAGKEGISKAVSLGLGQSDVLAETREDAFAGYWRNR